jgi:hypothetical protein
MIGVCLWVQEDNSAIKNMVTDQLKEVQETFGKHVQTGIVMPGPSNVFQKSTWPA